MYETRYSKFKNKTLHWLSSDTEQLYFRNLKNRYKELENFGWINRSFTYKFNSNGFRCNEFTDQPSILFLGCSHTAGVGLPLENIWPEKVSSQLKMACANLGIGASSIDTSFRICHGYIDKINPKIVVLMKPAKNRFELFMGKDPINFGHWSVNSLIYKEWLKNEYNDFFQRQRNVLAIKMLCEERKIKLIEADVVDYKAIDLARDLAHYGVNTHQTISNDILSKIQ